MGACLSKHFQTLAAISKPSWTGLWQISAPIKISRQRGESVVMISESDWESIEETLHLLSSPKNAARLAESIAELDAGNGQVRELIEP